MNSETYLKAINVLSLTIAFLGIVFAGFQCWINEKRRQNELFDRRYKFYVRLKLRYLSQHFELRSLSTEDWIPCAEEAGFLFGDDIQKHILSFADRKLSGSSDFPEEWFIQPFNKYLKV